MTLVIPVPSSKSMTQRALLLAATAKAPCSIEAPLDCDDSRWLRDALTRFGASFRKRDGASRLEVTPAPSPLRAPTETLFCGNAGTTLRFLAGLSLACDGRLELDGDARMRGRPIDALATALGDLGMRVSFRGERGFPPLAFERIGAVRRNAVLDASVSSQFASGLLMAGALLPDGLDLELTGRAVSRPYLDMTLAMMRSAGCRAAWLDAHRIRVSPGRARGFTMTIEADWSAAAFVLVAARVTERDMVPGGLLDAATSLQGDARITALLASLDTPQDDALDLTDAPDLLPPLVVAALFGQRPVRIRGAAHARVKECDRIAVLAREFRRIGATIHEHPDGLDVRPLQSGVVGDVLLEPEDDHRMAMAFGVASLRVPGIRVRNPACVSKSFPTFWDAVAAMRAATPSVTGPALR